MGASSGPAPLVLASANPKKVAELREILAEHSLGLELVPRPSEVPEVVEDAPDFVGNARLKAAALVAATGHAALADDSGLEVDALDGAPGVIAEAPRGDSGFGYDPVFVPAEGDGRTFAEMSAAEKHAISHRGRALRSLVAQLT